MTDKKFIHLVDDDEAIRHSASFMLRHAGYTVKTYADGVVFLEEITPQSEGCILLDVRMPVIDGLAVQKALIERGINLPIIILTGHGDVSVAVEAMKQGAIDFIEKPYEKAVLVGAIDSAYAHIEDQSSQIARQSDARAKITTLTPREKEVLERLVDGLTNKGIAADLNISSRTVEIHRAHLMEKLDAESLSSALKTAFTAGLGFGSE
ncbi:MAG: response regulator transcription factor [Hyphomonas sp.]